MCGRFANVDTADNLARRFTARVAPDCPWTGADECRPGMRLPVILCAGAQRHCRLATWGLRFAWTRRPLINLRIETIDAKASLAPLYRQQRCLIPATAFDEWRARQRFRFAQADGRCFALAGLWQVVAGAGYFAVLTVAPNALVARVHERMPVLLLPEEEMPYLAGADHPTWRQPFTGPLQMAEVA